MKLFVGLGVLALTACLDSKVKKPEVATPSDSVRIDSDSGELAESPSRRALHELAFVELPQPTFLEKLLLLLTELPPLGMTDISDFQAAYLKATEARDPTVPAPDLDLGLPKEVAFKATGCEAPKNEFRVYKGKYRLYQSRFIPGADPCRFENSESLEALLNGYLVGSPVKLRRASGASVAAATWPELRALLESEGFRFRVQYRIYFADFANMSEVSEDGVEREVPTPLWIDAGFRTKSGQSVRLPAVHSEILVELHHPKYPVAVTKVYFSDRSFVFRDDNQYLPTWCGDRPLYSFTDAELDPFFQKLPELHRAYRAFRDLFPPSLAYQGFGLLGVCNDGAALAMRAVFGEKITFPFPLIRTPRVKLPENFPLRQLWTDVVTDVDPSQFLLTPEERYRKLRPRILASNPFPGDTPFPEFNRVYNELRADEGSGTESR